jgi:hypothetical protein
MIGKIPVQGRKLFSVLELFLLLGMVPVLVMAVHGQVFRHGILLAGCLYTVFRAHRAVSWRRLFGRPHAGCWRGPLVRGALVFALAGFYVYCTAPEALFQLPLERSRLWLLIIVLYPTLSVLPQEIIYRVWVFEAHKPLWTSPVLPILVSALFFGWVHVIYAGWFAVLSCIAGGLALGWNYHLNRNSPGAIWPLLLEHSLYGLTMFTVGLGKYFFIPR